MFATWQFVTFRKVREVREDGRDNVFYFWKIVNKGTLKSAGLQRAFSWMWLIGHHRWQQCWMLSSFLLTFQTFQPQMEYRRFSCISRESYVWIRKWFLIFIYIYMKYNCPYILFIWIISFMTSGRFVIYARVCAPDVWTRMRMQKSNFPEESLCR